MNINKEDLTKLLIGFAVGLGFFYMYRKYKPKLPQSITDASIAREAASELLDSQSEIKN